jgi:ribose 5-phosphate isomerase B
VAADLVSRKRWNLKMRIAIGANKRGRAVLDLLGDSLEHLGHEVERIVLTEGQTVDYPEIAAQVAQQVQQGRTDRGILIGRTGMGMCLAANKFAGVRAAACYDEFMAEASRRYLDVNILCLSADLLGEDLTSRIVEIWLATPFEGGRHAQRIERIGKFERQGSP